MFPSDQLPTDGRALFWLLAFCVNNSSTCHQREGCCLNFAIKNKIEASFRKPATDAWGISRRKPSWPPRLGPTSVSKGDTRTYIPLVGWGGGALPDFRFPTRDATVPHQLPRSKKKKRNKEKKCTLRMAGRNVPRHDSARMPSALKLGANVAYGSGE